MQAAEFESTCPAPPFPAYRSCVAPCRWRRAVAISCNARGLEFQGLGRGSHGFVECPSLLRDVRRAAAAFQCGFEHAAEVLFVDSSQKCCGDRKRQAAAQFSVRGIATLRTTKRWRPQFCFVGRTAFSARNSLVGRRQQLSEAFAKKRSRCSGGLRSWRPCTLAVSFLTFQSAVRISPGRISLWRPCSGPAATGAETFLHVSTRTVEGPLLCSRIRSIKSIAEMVVHTGMHDEESMHTPGSIDSIAEMAAHAGMHVEKSVHTAGSIFDYSGRLEPPVAAVPDNLVCIAGTE